MTAQNADTVLVTRGRFIDIEKPWEDLRPYDILDEGRVIRTLTGGQWGAYKMEVGPCHAEVEVTELADGPVCWWQPVWDQTHEEPVPREPIRVFRGDLPGYFCTAEPEGPRDPCSDRCPIRTARYDRDAWC